MSVLCKPPCFGSPFSTVTSITTCPLPYPPTTLPSNQGMGLSAALLRTCFLIWRDERMLLYLATHQRGFPRPVGKKELGKALVLPPAPWHWGMQPPFSEGE